LENQVSTGFKPGYQKWTVPATGSYVIEATGARGGVQPKFPDTPGLGALLRGEFYLEAGQELLILVGQMGADNPTYDGGTAGGGGTFVVLNDSNYTPLVVAGGGGGQGGDYARSQFMNATLDINGSNGGNNEPGGKNGKGGQGNYSGHSGGGFDGNGTSFNGFHPGGLSFLDGALGSDGGSGSGYLIGGFGGGGAAPGGSSDRGGGGGGYSGGSGSDYEEAGGGGSYNAGTNPYQKAEVGDSHGKVRILGGTIHDLGRPAIKLGQSTSNLRQEGRDHFLQAFGAGYRWATSDEITKAREAATPGSVNTFTASNQVKPRNLPSQVNEYGFDTSGSSSNYHIVKE
jgi:hypothetical protein